MIINKKNIFNIYNLTKNIQKTMLKEYSAIFTFSDIDKLKLQNLLQKENIYTSPFPDLDEAFASIEKEEFAIEKLIFVGSDVHTPNSILIVPIRVVSGIRTKILYSMAQLAPEVTTEVEIEKIHLKDNKKVKIAKDKNEFVNKINYLFFIKK